MLVCPEQALTIETVCRRASGSRHEKPSAAEDHRVKMWRLVKAPPAREKAHARLTSLQDCRQCVEVTREEKNRISRISLDSTQESSLLPPTGQGTTLLYDFSHVLGMPAAGPAKATEWEDERILRFRSVEKFNNGDD